MCVSLKIYIQRMDAICVVLRKDTEMVLDKQIIEAFNEIDANWE